MCIRDRVIGSVASEDGSFIKVGASRNDTLASIQGGAAGNASSEREISADWIFGEKGDSVMSIAEGAGPVKVELKELKSPPPKSQGPQLLYQKNDEDNTHIVREKACNTKPPTLQKQTKAKCK